MGTLRCTTAVWVRGLRTRVGLPGGCAHGGTLCCWSLPDHELAHLDTRSPCRVPGAGSHVLMLRTCIRGMLRNVDEC